MRTELRDALSALADGEVADPALVAAALREPDAGALILALAEARAALRDTTSELSEGFSSRVERELASQGRARLRLVKWPTSALCAGLGLTAGVIVGVLLAPVGHPRDAVLPAARPAPAAVAAVPAKPPGPASALAGAPPPAAARRVAPPAARSVYRFEVGRNWREGS